MINIKYLIRFWIIVISIGEVTAQNISGIINSYAKVTNIAGNALTIENLTGAEDDFNPGKKVLIIQMKGAEINRSNTTDYGSIIDIKEAGNFEFAIVESKTGSNPYTIVLHNLLRSYNPAAFVQVIAVPQYNEDIIVSGDIVSKPWSSIDGTGGVVALEATGTLTLAANIDVSGQGFAGGTPNPIPVGLGTDLATFVYSAGDLSGQKGEGIAIYGEEGAYAMGPLANGGGGGNNHNAGGGGGGNFSAGGSGGDSFYDNGGGGLPGKSLNFDPSYNKIFMGGGGGGGQQNDNHSSSGGVGGGIIIIRANKISTDCNATRSILANGALALNTTGNDGAGGGGAGGNILLEVNTFDLNCLIDVFVNGGNGGNVANTSQRHAGGGGGGAGAIRLLSDLGNSLVNFSSKSGEAGLDCVGCDEPTGTSGEPCEDESCNAGEVWHKPPNASPIAQDDIATTTQGVPVQIAVLDNDLDLDFNDILTVSSTSISDPEHGSLTLTDNVYTYTPHEGYIGDDSFSYQICDDDANSLCSEAQVYITVYGIGLKGIEDEALTFSEGQEAIQITASIAVDKVGYKDIKGAVVSISDNFVATEDVLSFTNTHHISGSWDADEGTLTMTGAASLAHYQAALRSVSYQNTNNDNPSDNTRTVSFMVNDGEVSSAPVSRDIQVIPVNDAPELSAVEAAPLEFTEGDNATIITATILIKDVDNDNLESATIAISGNYWETEDILAFTDGNGITGNWDVASGTLTLTGNASLAHYQAALRSITYQNTNNDNPSDNTRTVSFMVNDGEVSSAPVSRDIQVIPVNDAPELSAVEAAPLEFTEGDNATIITATILTKDVDNNNLESATVSITANYWATEDVLAFTDGNGITGNWDGTNGILTLTGAASLEDYQAALRSVSYQNTNNDNPSDNTRTVSFMVNDGEVSSAPVSRDIQVIPVNDAPELSAVEAAPLEFTEGDNATIITATILTKDVDNDNLESATIAISGNYWGTEDVLVFTNTSSITGSWDVASGTLTLTGNASLAHYQTALRSVTYQNTNNDNPSDDTRTISFMVNDGELDSEPVSREIQVIPVNDEPELSAIETDPLEFTEGDNATIITANIEVKDGDNDNLESATIAISGNYWETEDILAFTDGNGITGNWDVASGTLTLTGNASLAHYQAALRSITYQNTNNDNPSDNTRTVSFMVNDGELESEPVTRDIQVLPVNDAPIAQNDVATTDKNVAVVIPVLENDYDVENDKLTVAAQPFTPPTNGKLVLNTDNTFTYTPNFNFFGTDSFVYTVCDDGDPIECSTALVSITINYKNYPPVAKDDQVTTHEDEAILIAVLANDADPDEDVLTVSKKLVTKPNHGKLVLADNKYTYTPHLNYNGYDSFEYEICDSGTPTICATASVAITIIPVNDVPEPADDYYANKDVIPEITGNVLDNDYDIEGDHLSVSLDLLVMPKNGALSMQEDGNFSYLPHPGFFGIDTFEYFACDDGIPALCTKATVTLKVSSGIPKGFSPNGDGINDAWHISGIEAYPMNTVVVFNRWGDTVFEVSGYDNASKTWRGEANKGLKTGSGDLPDGTYFYVIDFGNGKTPEKGFIIIKR